MSEQPQPQSLLERLVFAFVPLLRLASRLGFVDRWLRTTIGGRSREVFRLRDRGQPQEALTECMSLLDRLERPNELLAAMWWFYLDIAAELARELDSESARQELERRILSPPVPPSGREAADAYVSLAQWADARGDLELALAHFERALSADPSLTSLEEYLKDYRKRTAARSGPTLNSLHAQQAAAGLPIPLYWPVRRDMGRTRDGSHSRRVGEAAPPARSPRLPRLQFT